MTLRNLLATNSLLVGWGAFALLVGSALTANVAPWPDGLPEHWFVQIALLAAVGIGSGVFLRRHPWQQEVNITAYLDDGAGCRGLDVEGLRARCDPWPDGLMDIVWLP